MSATNFHYFVGFHYISETANNGEKNSKFKIFLKNSAVRNRQI